MGRRTFLRGVPAAGVAIAVPVVASASPKPTLTQDERIEAALTEIAAVFRERYPDCPIRVEDVDRGGTGMIILLAHCEGDAAKTYTHNRRRNGIETVKVSIDDGSPLRADDVTGTNAYANWEARKLA